MGFLTFICINWGCFTHCIIICLSKVYFKGSYLKPEGESQKHLASALKLIAGLGNMQTSGNCGLL